MSKITRRQLGKGLGAMAFSGLAASLLGTPQFAHAGVSRGYGILLRDSRGLLDLPAGFSYRVISKLGDKMSDGLSVPDRADGMGCLPIDEDRVALIRNHELHPRHLKKQPADIQVHKTVKAYDEFENGVALPGGTSTLIYNVKTQAVEREFMSLTGTIRNCAGGITPWGSWLTCEESVDKAINKTGRDHGYIFEVPAAAEGLVEPRPLVEMGRFNHEAAAVDPASGVVYLTEDRGDSLFYRFIPNQKGQLHQGGRLQALVVKSLAGFDTRNWKKAEMPLNQWFETEWIDLDNPQSPEDDLRKRGYNRGAAVFARGEGIHWADEELYFCCTNGGHKQLGQIMRYQPSKYEGTPREIREPGKLQLFLESEDPSLYNFGDNLTVTPQGHLMVCEDQYTETIENHLRLVTPQGKVFPFAKVRIETEPAGACFSPDGSTMFVNLYGPAKTLAITGPWDAFIG